MMLAYPPQPVESDTNERRVKFVTDLKDGEELTILHPTLANGKITVTLLRKSGRSARILVRGPNGAICSVD
jgi:hypothetical protein